MCRSEERRTLIGMSGRLVESGEFRSCRRPTAGSIVAHTGSDDRTVRICDPTTADLFAMVRVAGPLTECRWSHLSEMLAFVGIDSIFLFAYIDLAEPVRRPLGRSGQHNPARPETD